MTTDLDDLAARVEAATGADRELDCAIIKALYGVNPYPVSERLRGPGVWEYYLDDGPIEFVPLFTASLDAAMTLAPVMMQVGVLLDAIDACQSDEDNWLNDLPRFVTAAALRAQAALRKDQP